MKKPMKVIFQALLAGGVVLSLIVQISHRVEGPAHGSSWENIPGFFILFGFLGCLALVAVSLALSFLRKREGYYGHD